VARFRRGATRSRTANLGDGDILVADRAYTDFGFLNALALRSVFFVVREKTNLVMEVLEALQGPVEFNADSKAGTAGGWKSGGAKPKPLYLQGFLPFSLSPMGQHLAKS
jgi:hypothetical protein